MINLRNPRSFFIVTCLCLVVCSLASLPLMDVAGFPVLEMIESDSVNPLDQVEFDEDFLSEHISRFVISGLIFLRSGQINLDFLSARFSPAFPPPKTA